MVRSRRRRVLLAAAVFSCLGAAPHPAKVIAHLDLSKPFRLPPGALFTATQGPDVEDPVYGPDNMVPGSIHLCVRAPAEATCAPNLDDSLVIDGKPDEFSEIHYLENYEIVYPKGRGAPPLLHLQMASFHAGNGSQNRTALILAYRSSARRFEQIFKERGGGNNNQETRYIAAGPLKGAMITVFATDNAPYGYWVTVHRLTSDYRYQQVLRYRSATLYNDGNSLAVIDSEMPNILRRLGLWRAGQPLPLPEAPCPRPHLMKTELWCS